MLNECPIWLTIFNHLLACRCPGTGFYKQATRSNRHILKNKVIFGDRNTLYLCLEVVTYIKFNYFPCGFKSRAASVKFNYFPLRFTWQRCRCYLSSASGTGHDLLHHTNVFPHNCIVSLYPIAHFCGHLIPKFCLWYLKNYSISSMWLTAEIWRKKKFW